MSRVVVVSGSGRFADPWHPFPATSAALAGIAADLGHDVLIDEHVEERLIVPGDADLLVLNIGNPETLEPGVDGRLRAGLAAYLDSGRPLLVSHCSVSVVPLTEATTSPFGGFWHRGITMHPEYGASWILAAAPSALTAGIASFEVHDERYAFMELDPDVVPLLQHEHDGLLHPLLWEWTVGPAPIVVDLLGHDAASYASPEHRTIVSRAITSLLTP